MRWYRIPVEAEISAEEYLERAKRLHAVAEDLPPAIGARFEEMSADAVEIANLKMFKVHAYPE
jgi:hypothetical protein